jgi:SOS-response transcriptional repressor LexA
MFDKLSDNLNLLMAEVHISADELARRTGLPASTIKKIRNRYNPNPTLTTLLPLARYFLVTLGQLVGNEPLPAERIKGIYLENVDVMRHVPILSWLESLDSSHVKTQSHATITTEHDYSQQVYALIVEEDDWENLVKGTALIIDPTLTAEHRDFALVYKEGQSVPTLKQILYDEGQIYLKSVVQGYNIVLLTPEHKILGVVVEYKKQLRKNNSVK